MLVLASDLHLTDGTTCANITPDAFSLFTERVIDLAYRASWRATDTMAHVTFFKGDERRGRPYETWTGTLGTE